MVEEGRGPPVSKERPQHGPAGRYRQIMQTLARHGLGYMVDQLGLWHLAPSRFHLRERRRPAPATQAERIRLVCEDLGTTFVKLGQILSTRADLLPPGLAAELAKLQDAVPPEPIDVVEATIAHELGQPPAAIFARLNPQPLGSASIGQVHAATLITGEEVVVKVQRPGVEQQTEEDLTVLLDLARLAQARTAWGRVHNLPAIVEDFAQTLRSELDYVREGHNAERIGRCFAHEPRVRVPAIYWPYTTCRLLTMERIHGIKISDTAALVAAGIDLRALSATLLEMSLKMVLENGFFHADPHPGNFVVLPDGTIGLLDYGMVGMLDYQTRENVLYLLLAMVEQDLDRLVDQLLALGIVGTPFQVEQMKRDMAHLLSPSQVLPGQVVDIRRFLDGLLAMAYRRQLLVPAHLLLMSKTIMMHEALARACDPECDTGEVLGQYARQVAIQIHLPHERLRRLLPSLLDLGQLAFSLPRRVHRLLLEAEQGHFTVNIRVQDTERILQALNRMVTRLTLAIVAAGLVVGTALLLQTYGAPGFQWLIGWLLVAGFLGAATLAIWVIVTALRHR